MSAGRLERNRAKPEGMTALDWLKKVVSQKPTWDKGRKIGVTGIEMLGKKDLWPTDDGLGERLRKTMLAAVRAYKNAPMWTSEMEQEVFGKPETPAETPKAETPEATKGDNSIRHNVSSNETISPSDKAIYGMAAEGKGASEILKLSLIHI